MGTILSTGVCFGSMTYADIAEGPSRVVRYYSSGAAERVYFYNQGYVRDAIAQEAK